MISESENNLVNIIDSKIINHNDSAFPTIVKLDNGDLICGFNVGGGPEVATGRDHPITETPGSMKDLFCHAQKNR